MLVPCSFSAEISKNYSGTNLDNTFLRNDSTGCAFWSETHRRWFMPGSDTAGFVYGSPDGQAWVNGGSYGGFKWAFGCEAGDRLVLVNGKQGGGHELDYSYSDAGSPTSFTDATFPGTVASAAQVNDVVWVQRWAEGASNTGRVIAVGGIDGIAEAWTSSDRGVTFTKTNVDLTGGNLSRVIVGKDGALVAWKSGGTKLYVSLSAGTTWFTRALGFTVVEGAFAGNSYVFTDSSGNVQACASDATTDAFYTFSGTANSFVGSTRVYRLATFGTSLLASVADSGANYAIYASDAFATAVGAAVEGHYPSVPAWQQVWRFQTSVALDLGIGPGWVAAPLNARVATSMRVGLGAFRT